MAEASCQSYRKRQHVSVVSDWGDHIKGFFNADEIGLFYQALPTRSLAVNGEEAKGEEV